MRIIFAFATAALALLSTLSLAQSLSPSLTLTAEEQRQLGEFVAQWDAHRLTESERETERESVFFGEGLTLSPFVAALRDRLRVLLTEPAHTEGLQGDEKILRICDLLFLEREGEKDTGPILHAAEAGSSSDHLLFPEAHDALTQSSHNSRSLQGLPSMGPKRSLSESCANQMCDMLQYHLSCKALQMGFNKICAKYFLGNLYACPIFPPPSEFFSAPSVCLTQITGFFASLSAPANSTQVVPLSQKIARYLNPKQFESNACTRRCFQRLSTTSNTFYNNASCVSQLQKYNTTYPLVFALSNFQQFRNHACSRNETKANCYVTMSSASSQSAPLPLSPDMKIDPFAFTCSMVSPPISADMASVNKNVMKTMCLKTYAPMGCCAAQGFQLVSQNPVSILATPSAAQRRLTTTSASVNEYYSAMTGSSDVLRTVSEIADASSAVWQQNEDNMLRAHAQQSESENTVQSSSQSVGASPSPDQLTLFPPCLFQFWTTMKCPVVLDVTCNNGSTATQTTLKGWFLLYQFYGTPGVKFPLPNVYDKSQVFNTQAVLGQLITKLDAKLAAPPYSLASPLKFMITGYQYYSGTGVPLSPYYNGSILDYQRAAYGNFSYMITMQNVEAQQANYVKNIIKNQNFAGALAQLYGGNPQAGKFPQVGSFEATPLVFAADPLDVSHSGAASRLPSMALSLSAVLLAVLALML